MIGDPPTLPVPLPRSMGLAKTAPTPVAIALAGTAAENAWNEFLSAHIRNQHTRTAYLRAVRQFLAWIEPLAVPLERITPAMVGEYFQQHPGSVPSRKLHLSALRSCFDIFVIRHVMVLNPAASVRGERYSVVEGKTPEISKDHARRLIDSIDVTSAAGLRDRALLATLIYTSARDGAVAALRISDYQFDGVQYSLRFTEKGGKSRLIPVRHDLQLFLCAYIGAIDPGLTRKDMPLFRAIAGRSGTLTSRPIRNVDIYRMMKRRLRDASLPNHFTPHSCRVATITDLLAQGVPLEDVQHLAGHADPRTTRLYDRRKRQITRNTVERISI